MFKQNCDLVWFTETLKNKSLIEKIKKIKLIITDIDGCLTDSNVYGIREDKGFSVQDGFATKQAQKQGVKIAFLTGKDSPHVKERAKILGIPDELVFIGVYKNKIEKVKQIQESLGIPKEETLYFGDDFLDYEAKDAVELFTCPLNTPFYIQKQADLIIPKNGGVNVFRLLLDLVLYVQNKHFAQKLTTSVN